MDTIQYIFKFIYRIRLWLVIAPLATTLLVIYKTKNMSRSYEVSTTIYTGIASGYNIESDGSTRLDWSMVNNTMENLINIIRSKATLERVSIRLYAENMIYGDSLKDNNHLQARTYNALRKITPKDVQALIDKSSVEKTIANLKNYEKPNRDNFVFGLFNWYHPHYSFNSLSKIDVRRTSNSDMLDIKYTADDPGIAFHTIRILNEEFVYQYRDLRFGETNDVIKYFENELVITGGKLRNAEDSLTQYNIENKIINYPDQTREIAAVSSDFLLDLKEISRAYNSSKALLQQLEGKIDEHVLQLKQNAQFLSKLNNISDLTSAKTQLEAFNSEVTTDKTKKIQQYKNQLQKAESDLLNFSDTYNSEKYSKEGISSDQFIEPWMNQLLINTKAKAELEVLNKFTSELDMKYAHFAPIGSTIKRKEREINFTEQNYLSLLSSLNTARLRQKNLQMSSASLKILNAPVFPISPAPTKRRALVGGTFAGTIIFILGFFIILELIDRTLRDKIRTERITKAKVLGAFPGANSIRFRGYNKECERMSTIYLINSIRPYLSYYKTNYINFLSMEPEDGKSYLIDHINEYFSSIRMNTQVIQWDMENPDIQREYLKMEDLSKIQIQKGVDILLIEHPALQQITTPSPYLENAAINILVVRADKVWTSTSQVLLNRLQQQSGSTPLFLYLNRANRHSVEIFTGMLPPYTKMRKLFYKIYQLGLTSK